MTRLIDGLRVKRAQLHHASQLNKLFMQSVSEDFAYFSPSYRAMLKDQHTKWRFIRALASPETLFYIIVSPVGEPVGYNLMRRDSPKTAFLHWMYLDPRWRGRGHGAAIVSEALSQLSNRGVQELRLVTHNKAAFYEKLGFNITSTLPIRLGGVEMCLMEYKLN